jgi:CRISPR system Cascade subunit CasE
MNIEAPVGLRLLRLVPDLQALARWVAAGGQSALREDTGYALHAALRACLGTAAPKPFALVERPGSVQLIGYSAHEAATLERAVSMAATSDPLAAVAIGLSPEGGDAGLSIRTMPSKWRRGEQLSFEARVAPVVRSRDPASGPGYPEIDAAFHRDFAGADFGDRAAAHGRWLARELGRGGAAEMLGHRVTAFRLSPMARRSQRENATARRTSRGLLPDLTVRGQLRVGDSDAFCALLARGLGRHRSFGYGCLLIAPAGAWT